MGYPTLVDKIVFGPDDVDQEFRPIGDKLELETEILGTFNPGMIRLSNGNILLMVRVAEKLVEPERDGHMHLIRWFDDNGGAGYRVDGYPMERVIVGDDPRLFKVNQHGVEALALTSLSYLLPVEMDSDGLNIIKRHYDKAIFPSEVEQEFGLEDARLFKMGETYYMTVVGVSSGGACTYLYESIDGIKYSSKGVIFAAPNKDVVPLPEKIDGLFYSFSRPEFPVNFAGQPNSLTVPGKQINLSQSPDLRHWAYVKRLVQLEAGTLVDQGVGPGAPPMIIDGHIFELYHGVKSEKDNPVGLYATFGLWLQRDDPTKILKVEKNNPILEHNPKLTADLKRKAYIPGEVTFTTGLADGDDNIISVSGYLDEYVRTTVFKKRLFKL